MDIFFKPSFIKDFKKLPKNTKADVRKICSEDFLIAKCFYGGQTQKRHLQNFSLTPKNPKNLQKIGVSSFLKFDKLSSVC